MYTFLHDISKADCLLLKYTDGQKKEVTWEEWQSGLPPEAKTDPRAMKEYCDRQNIESISCYHKDAKHGESGAEKLKPLQEKLAVPPKLLTAIEKHEVAYQFSKVDTKAYEKHLGSLSEEGKN